MHGQSHRDTLHTSEQGDQLFTVKEVAQKLCISRSLVYRLVDSGTLACHRLGLGRGTIRIREQDLADYLQRCRQKRGEEAPRALRPKLKHLRI